MESESDGVHEEDEEVGGDEVCECSEDLDWDQEIVRERFRDLRTLESKHKVECSRDECCIEEKHGKEVPSEPLLFPVTLFSHLQQFVDARKVLNVVEEESELFGED
jgi:hypothetical protein